MDEEKLKRIIARLDRIDKFLDRVLFYMVPIAIIMCVLVALSCFCRGLPKQGFAMLLLGAANYVFDRCVLSIVRRKKHRPPSDNDA